MMIKFVWNAWIFLKSMANPRYLCMTALTCWSLIFGNIYWRCKKLDHCHILLSLFCLINDQFFDCSCSERMQFKDVKKHSTKMHIAQPPIKLLRLCSRHKQIWKKCRNLQLKVSWDKKGELFFFLSKVIQYCGLQLQVCETKMKAQACIVS